MKRLLFLAMLLAENVGANYQLQTLNQAHGMFHAATNTSMYAAAARQYEYLVKEEGIRNGDLFYTLGNTWYLAGDIGRAILNYRRAEQLLPNSTEVRHNLASALEQRTDLIPLQEQNPTIHKLLGWHFNTSPMLRWWLFATCWLMLWGAWGWLRRTRKKEARITLVTTGLLSAVLLISLLTESIVKQRTEPGVILAAEVLARKGDGEMYAPAFLDPLHSGTEFKRLKHRGTWWQIRLTDGQECWIPARSAELISLSES